jgi:hypothetical protein
MAGFFLGRNTGRHASVAQAAPSPLYSTGQGAPQRCGFRRGSRLTARTSMAPAKRIYEPRIFEGRVMLSESKRLLAAPDLPALTVTAR